MESVLMIANLQDDMEKNVDSDNNAVVNRCSNNNGNSKIDSIPTQKTASSSDANSQSCEERVEDAENLQEASSKKVQMRWTLTHKYELCKIITVHNPFKAAYREKAATWDMVLKDFNKIRPGTKRNNCDRVVKELIRKHRHKCPSSSHHWSNSGKAFGCDDGEEDVEEEDDDEEDNNNNDGVDDDEEDNDDIDNINDGVDDDNYIELSSIREKNMQDLVDNVVGDIVSYLDGVEDERKRKKRQGQESYVGETKIMATPAPQSTDRSSCRDHSRKRAKLRNNNDGGFDKEGEEDIAADHLNLMKEIHKTNLKYARMQRQAMEKIHKHQMESNTRVENILVTISTTLEVLRMILTNQNGSSGE
eukprot:m.41172 g.41172  ORF g.41172 m.41172 type:complete len:361 (-) comp6982_c0_seq2:140-1222(-)